VRPELYSFNTKVTDTILKAHPLLREDQGFRAPEQLISESCRSEFDEEDEMMELSQDIVE